MDSILNTLLNLQLRSSNKPTEDYLTVIFAFCLSDDKELLADYLKHFKIHLEKFEEFSVTTQLTLKALEQHRTDSRPDIKNIRF